MRLPSIRDMYDSYRKDLPRHVEPVTAKCLEAYMNTLSPDGKTYWCEQLRFGFAGRLHVVLHESEYDSIGSAFDEEDDDSIAPANETLQ